MKKMTKPPPAPPVPKSKTRTADSITDMVANWRDQALENARSVILRWAPDGEILFLNKYGCELFGFTEQEIIGRNVVGSIVPEKAREGKDLARMIREISLDVKKFRVNENENMTKTGRRIWISWTNSPLLSPSGRLLEILSIGIDSTKRKLAEEELKGRDAILQAVSFAANNFLSNQRWEKDIPAILERLGRAARVGRVYIFQQREQGGGEAAPVHVWAEDPENDFPPKDLDGLCRAGRELWGENPPKGPIHGQAGGPKAPGGGFQLSGDVLSFLAAPIFVNEKWWGVICFEDLVHKRDWSGAEVDSLKTAADVLGSAIQRELMEKEIKDSHAVFNTVINSLDAGVYAADINTNEILFANSSIRKDCGEDFSGKKCFEYLQAGQSKPCKFCTNKRIVDKNGRPSAPCVWEFKNTRSGKWFHLNDRAVVWPDGRIVRLEVATDISQRKKAEEELKYNEKLNSILFRISNAVSASKDLVALLREIRLILMEIVDAANFHVALADEKKNRLEFLYFKDEKDETNPAVTNIKDPGRSCLTLEVIRKAKPFLLSKQEIRDIQAGGEIMIFGSVPESWLGVPLSVKNRIIGAVVVKNYDTPGYYTDRDVKLMSSIAEQIALSIDRKQTEEELKESQKRLTLVLEANNDGVWDWDIHSGRIYYSQKFFSMLGRDRRDFSNTYDAFINLIHPRDRRMVVRLVNETFKTDSPFITEFRMSAAQGGWKWIMGRGKVVSRDKNGSPLRMLGTTTDISTRKKMDQDLFAAKEAAETASKAKSLFLANMSHEIRTPLNGVMGMLQLAMTGPLEPEQRDYLMTAMSSARSLLVVLNDILDLSSIEAGRFRYNEEVFSLEELFEGVAAQFALPAADKGLSLETSIAPDAPDRLSGDKVRIIQILNNLVGNSIKYSERGRISISVRKLEGGGAESPVQLLFSVRDQGVGIPKEKIDQMFEPFTQADQSRTRAYQGAGLGLSIVKSLVNLMGGELIVTSRLGGGTEISFSLELKPAGDAAAPRPEPSRNAGRQGRGGLDILVIEDDKVNQLTIERLLQKMGCRVECADNGKQGLEALVKKEFDCIFMDIQMPVLDGVKTARLIRRRLKLKTPIVALTAHAMKGDRKKFLASGMDHYLAKPVEIYKLEKVLAQIAPAARQPPVPGD